MVLNVCIFAIFAICVLCSANNGERIFSNNFEELPQLRDIC